MKAISICGPWWWYIMQGIKPVENRDWPSKYRGPLLIQVSQKILEADRVAAMDMAKRAGWTGRVPTPAELQDARGHIVGIVQMVDCVERHPSPFFTGRYGHVYAKPELFAKPIRCRGELNLFAVQDSLLPAGIGRPQSLPVERLDFSAALVGDTEPERRTFMGVDLAAKVEVDVSALRKSLASDPSQRRLF